MNFSRRTVLGGALGGAALLSACGDDGGSGGGTSTEVSFGSNYSDAVPKAAMGAVLQGYQGRPVKINTVDHNSFQENINRYLQGNPDDVFCWFAGYRMQFFAKQGLAGDISDVWKDVGGNFSDALKAASTGEDGKQYLLPFYNYPWGVFYRKSVWQQHGYSEPANLDAFKALCDQMKKDGLVPLAFADKDGWPAMGTFDYLDMRINGYQFHVELMAGKQAWTDAKLKTVFDTWRGLLPYHQPGANGRTWQEAAQSLLNRQTGMYVVGTFVGEQFPGAELDDLDFFAFPEINPEFGRDSVEAPIDGFMMAAKPKNAAGAKDLLRYLATGPAELAYLKTNPVNIAANKTADTSGYAALQKKSAELISSAKHISQFLDRDTRPDFASTVMIPAIQTFIGKPNDVDGLLKSIESQKKSIFTS